METGDLRHLLDCDELPEYDVNILVPVWDNIMREYEKLTNSQGYTSQLRKINNINYKLNRLNGLIACVYLVKYQYPTAQKHIKIWGAPESVEGITTLILQEKTRLNIEAIRNSHVKKNEETISFDKLAIIIQYNLERNLDIDNMTVVQWVHWCNVLKDKATQLEKIKNNGRSRKNNSTGSY